MTPSLLLREILWRHISKTKKPISLKFCTRNALMAVMIHTKFHFNRLMLTLIFCIWASDPPRAWWTTEKAGPDRVKWNKTTLFHIKLWHSALKCFIWWPFDSWNWFQSMCQQAFHWSSIPAVTSVKHGCQNKTKRFYTQLASRKQVIAF